MILFLFFLLQFQKNTDIFEGNNRSLRNSFSKFSRIQKKSSNSNSHYGPIKIILYFPKRFLSYGKPKKKKSGTYHNFSMNLREHRRSSKNKLIHKYLLYKNRIPNATVLYW